ncbi:MAG: FAD-dependent oxidoreductase [Paludibacter sp.]
MHIAILGNSILGLMTARAWLLAQPGVQLTIVGRSHRPGSASMAAAAMLNSFAELEHDSLGTELDRFKFDLSRAATALWPAVFAQICPDRQAVAQGFGTYILNNAVTDELDDDNFGAIRRFADEFAEPYTEVDPAQIPNYQPEPRHRALRALLLKREGWVNPKQFLRALQHWLEQHPQVQWRDTEVTRLDIRQGRVQAAGLAEGAPLAADDYVLANGANLTRVLKDSAPELPVQRLFYGVGVSLELQYAQHVHTHCVRTPNRGLACGVYSVPYGPEQTLIGASNYISPVSLDQAHVGSTYTLLKAAMEQINFNFYRASIANVNVGWRPTTSDTYPLFGATSIKGLWIIGGTKRDGFHLSPVICGDLVGLMRGEAIAPGYAQLAPERALIRNMSREAAIEKAVRHQLNASYQHDFVSAKNRMVEQLRNAYRADLEALHDKVGAHEWGIPPELLDMYRYGHIPGTPRS